MKLLIKCSLIISVLFLFALVLFLLNQRTLEIIEVPAQIIKMEMVR